MPTYAINKKARFDYEILETFEAGLVLTGSEVKAIRSKQIKLTGSFVTIHDGAAYLLNTHISKYKYATIKDYEPERSRKILLNKKQIAYLTGKIQEKGLTILPLSVYTKGRKIKVEIGIGHGKKQFDKKRILKERQESRDMHRALKGDY
ncbi:MAG: SsrA-binding protein [Candidatus Magasanikbacteria bacterium CG_4_10_14_0_8_um_filter_32_14]|uniref:SsrA-binding protein n=2 Tax=Candidatus Magasanikiibacteriota TaxID=1752731 RepID=A0A2M7R931_9BACT|nr:MAG: SsrA-binding protein [Candidatus Magasanikbacteria bacterium CG1_02_32_51]PIY93071.1 MAG: SsrA-binding protein [Candidatus Magasanikbacteria bacterium CG_4_10_14_0_8_um_filter_32_14]